jgi:DNA-binding CsgD family transcriptional regulator
MLGRAQLWGGAVPQAKNTFDRAAAVARRHTDTRRLALAALGYAGNIVRPGVFDAQVVTRLTEALDTLTETSAVLRVRLLARLAMEYRYSPRRELGEELSHKALVAARRLAHTGTPSDETRATLAYALNARHFAILAPDTLEDRMAISLELAELAYTHNDRELLLQNLPWRVADLLTLSRGSAADEAIAEATRIAEEIRQPLYLWYSQVFRAMRALMHGNWQEAEQFSEAGYHLGQRIQPGGADVYRAAQRFLRCWETGQLAEVEPVFADLVACYPTLPVLQCVHALVLWHAGQESVARTALARLCAEQAALIPRDQLWLGALALLAELAVLSESPAEAAVLYELLLPHAERVVVVGVPICLGAVASYLGGLATLLGPPEAALAHYRRGLAINQKLAIRPFVVRTQLRYAALLAAQAAPESQQAARELLTQAQSAARELGMCAIMPQIEQTLAAANVASARAQPRQAPSAEALRREFTPREAEVLTLLAAGHSTKAIAKALTISVPTVERHLTHIYEKLGVRSRAEAIAAVLRQGLA